MVQVLKTDRQVSYKPKNQNAHFVVTKETLTIHRKTRSKQLVQQMSTCISLNKYTEMMKLENQLVTALCKKLPSMQGGIYITPFVVKNEPEFFCSR